MNVRSTRIELTGTLEQGSVTDGVHARDSERREMGGQRRRRVAADQPDAQGASFGSVRLVGKKVDLLRCTGSSKMKACPSHWPHHSLKGRTSPLDQGPTILFSTSTLFIA